MGREGRKWGISFAIIATITILVATFTAQALSKEQEWTRKTRLCVDDVYFLLSKKGGDNENAVSVIATLYLTNAQANGSGDVKIVAYVIRSTTGAADDKNIAAVGRIEGSETKEVEVEITVPSLGTMYEVDFLIFESELLVLRGKGKIGISRITLDGHFVGYRLDASTEEFERV